MQKSSLDRWDRIFVNRSLNMSSIKSIGFDMDHTLAQYNRAAFEALAFNETLAKFIDAGYPQELSELKFDPDFVIRGLLVDRKRGNLLKVDAHKYVKQAFHGRLELEKKERHRLYNAKSFKAESFLSVDTFFALSEVQLFVEIVDFMRTHPGVIEKSFEDVYRDLRTYIDLSHADGSIKKKVIANPEKYLIPDKSRPKALLRHLEGGKSLFLLTNSHWDYTNILMSFLYEESTDLTSHWKDYFDYIIVGSGKPGFFTGSQPFFQVMEDTGLLKPHSGKFEKGKVYHGGNGHKFQEITNQRGDEILYCGDHIYGDIIRSKEVFNWRTLAVVEELEDTLKKPNYDHWQDIKDSLSQRESIDEETQKIRTRIRFTEQGLKNGSKKNLSSERSLENLKSKLEELEAKLGEIDRSIKAEIKERDRRIHPFWGDFLRVGLEKSRFAKQISIYACLYTTDIGNLRFYSSFKRFHSPYDLMPHDDR